MTGIPSAPAFSRFHAIVTATPRDGFGPPVINTEYLRTSTHPQGNDSAPSKKRKRTSDDEDDSSVGGKTVKTDKRSSARKATAYRDIPQLLNALRERFQQGPHVEFHGYCQMEDPGMSHRQRVQTMTNDIWRTTGYRFTVKDHPRINNGHKSRFWCSQDDTHKNKLKANRNSQGPKPRLTSTGDVMAKTRYPCKSRLLISSRDSGVPGQRIITVRLGHHLAHEPYVDSSMMPEVVKSIWETFGWANQRANETVPPNMVGGTSNGTHQMANGNNEGIASNSINPLERDQQQHDPEGEDSEDDQSDIVEQPIMDPPMPIPGTLLPPQTMQPPPPPQLSLERAMYHQRMRSHIANIRDFCDGLEYQLQFDDTRMLEVVEREGRSFLNLVEDCLRKEGRLVTMPADIPLDPTLMNAPMALPSSAENHGPPLTNGYLINDHSTR
ncbi:hypothetical protein CC1G_10040 [Coprinopsis cinerea okayama7|uniref:Uncharacterized protein n=1 Tax=Coprinopsis cinerea (strain Okayama-7 / 130 / ATCC MYA-4618 / FGSC 9003) TaxID=240176 RepID=A8NUW1_COPC7|nr:hypothetical protein CC1G_10040 [Coprinopsis cinerea okayama7\|eukprot:XP_001836546.1 hypothetical protein CC1G_10040 [Coprinopsis cinerea okayama7\